MAALLPLRGDRSPMSADRGQRELLSWAGRADARDTADYCIGVVGNPPLAYIRERPGAEATVGARLVPD